MSASGRVIRVRPGDEIVTHCGRCRQERTHQVVALNAAGLPDRVVCRFCQSNHLYRGNKGGGSARSKKERSTKEQAESSRAAASPPRPYSAMEVYAEGETIEHSKFGQGRVLEARRGKIDVKFGKELRTLLHAG